MSNGSVGAGLGLRPGHYDRILERGVRAECAEVVSENFIDRGGRPRKVLERVRQDIPVILHGVGMSLGSVDPLDEDYLSRLASLAAWTEPMTISDHLCFSSIDGNRAYDLWPLPYTEEAIRHVSGRIMRAQDFLGRRICIENVSSYVTYRDSRMAEEDFLAAVLDEADCECLLDVNNVFVSARNDGFDPQRYIATLPAQRVRYYHLAGHSDYGTHLLDDHGSAVGEAVWRLYEYALEQVGPRPTIVEWDSNLPSLEQVEAQTSLAQKRLDDVALRAEVRSPSPATTFERTEVLS